ncbi:MAG: class I SAM-dependent methyltransferase [Sedimentisphaerales bacterium]|nr:class I SAM-dependent methyltransferase [Sedimentisphaerales bacterium]
MRTRIAADNPYGCDRYGFAWRHVPAGGAAHLDFGCGDGRFLAGLRSRRIGWLVGADVSQEAVRLARVACEEAEIVHLGGQAALPFGDGEFSSVSLLDVLEHVHEPDALLAELHRVLGAGGTLIVTVPGQHVFSALDVGNLKFRFPRLHRWFYCRRHSREEYDRRYAANPDGLVGDVSASKRWHEHFSRRKLAAVLNRNGFSVAQFDGAGLFVRILKVAELTVGRFGPLRVVIRRLMAWDARCFASANLFCVARKRASCAEVPK